MFIKGLKYEFRAVARIVMPMLIVLLAVAFLMSASFVLDGRVFHFSAALTETGTTEARELIAGLLIISNPHVLLLRVLPSLTDRKAELP